MTQPQHRLKQDHVGFSTIELFKDQTLGIGSYGAVCKAKCDNLLCAAKILHPTFFDPTAHQRIAPHREHRLPFSRFQQECEFMSAVRHPNIVQYLGVCQDPETRLPVLLMELMDDSLTHFLESSQEPLPYHTQLNFCHDIAQALSFLHSNAIIHRDLSSNNVLLIRDIRAKVADFGMAKLGNINPQATHISLTVCPGTDAYMPPEAVKENPVHTVKIDSFSFGVLVVQILTRQFPKPGDRLKRVQIDHPQFPSGTIQVAVSEIERRQNHLGQLDPNHPLQPIALDCMKDDEMDRPSAQELCTRIAALKESPQYSESVRKAFSRERIVSDQDGRAQQKEEQLKEQLQQNSNKLAAQEREIQLLRQQILALQQQLVSQNENLGKKRASNNPIQKLQTLLSGKNHDSSSAELEVAEYKDNIKLSWSGAKKAPYKTFRSTDAVVSGNMVYITPSTTKHIYAYRSIEDTWSQLRDCLADHCTLAVVNNLLTTIGGEQSNNACINHLFSLTEDHTHWTEVFPPMPTKRSSAAAVSSGTALIVAGGYQGNRLTTVEVLNTETRQWSTATDLPGPLSQSSATICGDCIYMLGGWSGRFTPTKSVYTCSISALIQSSKTTSSEATSMKSPSSVTVDSKCVWSETAKLPVTFSTCVTLHGRLLAIGGKDLLYAPTTAVYMYVPTTNRWEVISHIEIAWEHCHAAVLPNNRLMVVGGYTPVRGNVTDLADTVEIATVV